jgi:hypothetical protein
VKTIKIDFLKFKKEHPKARYIYAVTKGAFLGELLVYMETKTNSHFFLSLPEMTIRDIPADKFELGIKDEIVDIVEKLPKDVYKTCKLQYEKNISQIAVPTIK